MKKHKIFRMDPELIQKIKDESVRTGKSEISIVEDALKNYFEDLEFDLSEII